MERTHDASMKPTVSNEELAQRILSDIFERRRLHQGERDKDGDFQSEAEPHLSKIKRQIAEGKAVKMVLPAFPAKSPSRQKTLNHLPDMGEELAMRNLQLLCDRIQSYYSPGAEIVICSDGRVFADVVRIPDPHVTEYNATLRQIAKDEGLSSLGFFDLDDVYPNVKDYAALREELLVLYGEPLYSLQDRCRTEREAGEMYRGITKFLFEDFSALDDFDGFSKNAIQNVARTSAYRVIQRSNAWGRLLAEQMKDAVRLSIHPQFRQSEKIGINLIDDTDQWATPWHSVVLKDGDTVKLVQRHVAERMNAALVFRDGKPSHFAMVEAERMAA